MGITDKIGTVNIFTINSDNTARSDGHLVRYDRKTNICLLIFKKAFIPPFNDTPQKLQGFSFYNILGDAQFFLFGMLQKQKLMTVNDNSILIPYYKILLQIDDSKDCDKEALEELCKVAKERKCIH